MKDWYSHWQEFPASKLETSFLEQVGKTVNGIPVPEQFVRSIVSSIENNLLLQNDDEVLDLCCGNGLLTNIVSQHSKSVTGIDYSEVLIGVANKYNRSANVSYVCGSAMDVRSLVNQRFDKIYMYEALQHFTPSMLDTLLDNLVILSKDNQLKLFVGSVPDRRKLWKFYNTLSRKFDYFRKFLKKEEAIGTWWDRNNITAICKNKKLNVNFISQDPILHTAHYRFDMLITNDND